MLCFEFHDSAPSGRSDVCPSRGRLSVSREEDHHITHITTLSKMHIRQITRDKKE